MTAEEIEVVRRAIPAWIRTLTPRTRDPLPMIQEDVEAMNALRDLIGPIEDGVPVGVR